MNSYLLLWEWVPPSLNPLAKGLWSIFNFVIFKRNVKKIVKMYKSLDSIKMKCFINSCMFKEEAI